MPHYYNESQIKDVDSIPNIGKYNQINKKNGNYQWKTINNFHEDNKKQNSRI